MRSSIGEFVAEKNRYRTPQAFRRAIQDRLKAKSRTTGQPMHRLETALTMERFLARLATLMPDAVILKGGLALELRVETARATKDVDLRYSGSEPALLSHLQEAGRQDLSDHFQFEVTPDSKHPKIENPGAQYDGARFKVKAKLAGRPYKTFQLDVGIGDPLTDPPDEVVARDWLSFANISPPTVAVYPISSHIAEKLHAYTFPYEGRANSRVKDLPDLAILAELYELSGASLRVAIDRTFAYRGTHPVPTCLQPPPKEWNERYKSLATDYKLKWRTANEAHAAAARFIDPVLASTDTGTWSTEDQSWTE